MLEFHRNNFTTETTDLKDIVTVAYVIIDDICRRLLQYILRIVRISRLLCS